MTLLSTVEQERVYAPEAHKHHKFFEKLEKIRNKSPRFAVSYRMRTPINVLLAKTCEPPLKVVRAETQLAQDCSVILYTEFRQYNGCICKKSIVVTAHFLRN